MPKKLTELVPIMVRMPEALRRKLTKSAEENQRSLNGEVVWRLAHSFDILDLTQEEVAERFEIIRKVIEEELNAVGIRGRKR